MCNVPDYGTEEVADHALALTLALYRQLFPLDAEAKQLGWKIKVAPKMRRLRTQTFGIVGLGRIGTAAALRAKAFGFRVVFYDPHVPAGTHKAVGVERANSLAELFKQSDTVSVQCPLSAKTRGMIGAVGSDLGRSPLGRADGGRGGLGCRFHGHAFGFCFGCRLGLVRRHCR